MKNNTYFLLKLNRQIKNIHVKNLGIFLLHVFNKRYLGVFLDPVLGCNLRCRMCYFSNEEKRKIMKGIFTETEISAIADAFFSRALKLQIGCGAEPSLFHSNVKLVQLAKEKKVPYISITTNANLLTENDWRQLVEAGLNEVTLSLHGVTQQTYEYFMEGGSYPLFYNAFKALSSLKDEFPEFKIRINYTINKDNLEELQHFFDVFREYKLDILQLRPIQPIGKSDYDNFSWKEIYKAYDYTIQKLKDECSKRNIVCMAPQKEDLIKSENTESIVIESTYCYISPRSIFADDFNIAHDTYNLYAKRTRLAWKLFKNIFHSKKYFSTSKNKLNYDIN